ncbi:hypothetical protein O181_125694 [Austropuccinia psidii MF-1]|uniref:Uncharacterized protein n=1 Tax=Austropuccinia psidii MF-1 TaxID=1389203 RepID=A0A9Q3Q5G9_9BASI|nr:hypothetical protein [Austropuccinia psidii MF-1]
MLSFTQKIIASLPSLTNLSAIGPSVSTLRYKAAQSPTLSSMSSKHPTNNEPIKLNEPTNLDNKEKKYFHLTGNIILAYLLSSTLILVFTPRSGTLTPNLAKLDKAAALTMPFSSIT